MRKKMNLSEGRLLAIEIARAVAREIGVRQHASGQPKQIWKDASVYPSDGGFTVDADIDCFPRHISIRIVLPTHDADARGHWFEATVTWPGPTAMYSSHQGSVVRHRTGEISIKELADRPDHLIHA